MTVGSDTDGLAAVVPDPRRTAPGRGAHLHPSAVCYDLAVRRKAFARALRAPGGLNAAPVAEHLDSWHTTGAGPTRNWSSGS